MRSVGGSAPVTWKLAHSGGDLVGSAVTPDTVDYGSVYEGSLIEAANMPLTLVSRVRLQRCGPSSPLPFRESQPVSPI
jgi:hypothetical protein